MPDPMQAASEASLSPSYWIEEIKRGMLGTMTLAGLAVWFIVSYLPALQKEYQRDLDNQRMIFIDALAAKDIRHDKQMETLQNDCYAVSKEARDILRQNAERLKETLDLLYGIKKGQR